MLLKYRVSNFKSIGKNQEFSTVPGRYRKKKNHVYEGERYKSLKFSAIFGANASGKSNFVDSLFFLRFLILRGSIPKLLTDYKFRLKDLGPNTNFEVEVGINDRILIYGLSIDIKQNTVQREYLYYSIGGSDNLVFDVHNSKIDTHNLSTDAENRVKVYFDDLEAGQFMLNKLAKAKDVDDEHIFTLSKALHNWFQSKLTIITPSTKFLNKVNQFNSSGELKKGLTAIDILKSFDTGITDYIYDELKLEKFIEIIEKSINDDEVLDTFKSNINNLKDNQIIESNIDGNYYRISINKKTKEPLIQLLGFRHCNNNNKYFSYDEESDGTKRLIEIVNVLINVQNDDRTYIIDEIERSFHSNLTIDFIKKFLKYSMNNKSQLIITTHETNIMNFDLVRQDEIWLIDRNRDGMSSLVPLSDFNLRSEKARLDIEYLDGRYGAIPNILSIISGE